MQVPMSADLTPIGSAHLLFSIKFFLVVTTFLLFNLEIDLFYLYHISKFSKSGKGVRASGGSGAGWEERPARLRDGGARSPLPSQALPPDLEPQPRPAPPCSGWESLTSVYTPTKTTGRLQTRALGWRGGDSGRGVGRQGCWGKMQPVPEGHSGAAPSSAVTAPGVCKQQTRSWCVWGAHQGVREFW